MGKKRCRSKKGKKKGEKEAHRQTETDGRWYLLPTNHGRTRGSCGGSVGKLSLMANLLPKDVICHSLSCNEVP